MPIRVKANDNTIHVFPDDATESEINSVLDQYEMQKANFITGANRTPVDTIRDLLSGALGGAEKGIRTLGTAMTRGGETGLQGVPDVSDSVKSISDAIEKLSSPNKSLGGELVKGVGSYAPYAAAFGESIPGLIGAGAAHGYSTAEPDQENLFGLLPKGKMGSAIEGVLANLLPVGAMKTLEAMRPSKVFRGNLSPEELQRNLEVTQGTKTPLGDVIQSPKLKKEFENELPDYPFSNTYDVMQKNAENIKQKGNELIESVLPEISTENQNANLMDALKQAEREARNEKNAKWNKVNQIADNVNLKVKPGETIDMMQNKALQVGREQFAQKAASALEDINSSPELKNLLGNDIVKDLEDYSSNKVGNSLKNSNIFKAKLREKANELYSNSKNYEAGLIGGLADSLQDDIDAAIESSGSQELKDAYQEANRFHRENYGPFEDKDIIKFTRRGGDPDVLLSHFIRKGQNDRSNLAAKLITKLPMQHKLQPFKMLLNKAVDKNGKFSPLEFNKIYTNLGDNQKEILLPDPELRKKFDDYSRLISLNGESLNVMANPKTGARGLNTLANLRSGILALLGSGAGSAIGGAGAGLPGALAAIVLPGIGARMATKALTSPSLRESLVRNMIENKPKFDTIPKRRGATTLLQGIANALHRNQQ